MKLSQVPSFVRSKFSRRCVGAGIRYEPALLLALARHRCVHKHLQRSELNLTAVQGKLMSVARRVWHAS